MPGLPDTAVIVLLALLLFGPKKLPVLARQLGKLMADFRRASNEFRSQMEEELRISEQADRQKQVAAIQAAAPATPALEATTDSVPEDSYPHESQPEPSIATAAESGSDNTPDSSVDSPAENVPPAAAAPEPASVPIATSGDLSILPPATGLPVAHSSHTSPAATETQAAESELETETLHG